MCSYYHKFISHYSDITKCFNDVTKKGAVLKWTKECNTAFKLLKEELMEEPVLISLQVNKDYVMHCDTSKYNYSGILQQTRPGMNELASVAYFSGNFHKTQVKWNITEREAYATYKSAKRFAFYITGAKTTVFSDHKPLKNFFEGGMNIAEHNRWSLELQEFSISLEFIQGKLNKVADVIVRLKNKELYIENSDEKPIKVKVSQEDRIEEILDIATNPSNFEKMINMNKAFSIRKLLHNQKGDKFCRRLARSLHKQSDFMINHEGLLVKQISILKNIYQVYVVP